MNVVDAAGKAEMSMSEVVGGVDDVLGDLLRHQEILGALAVSVEGLIIGCAGIDESDAELAGAAAQVPRANGRRIEGQAGHTGA